MNNEKSMRLAISKAKEGIKNGQTPFGACIVKNRKVICCTHNTVWENTDITEHAEINAIRIACRKLNTINLSGCVIYSTCEPCPMCFSACHWARISKIVYGASIKDAKKLGFNEVVISNKKIKQLAGIQIEIVGGFLKEDNIKLFKLWYAQKNKRVY